METTAYNTGKRCKAFLFGIHFLFGFLWIFAKAAYGKVMKYRQAFSRKFLIFYKTKESLQVSKRFVDGFSQCKS